MNKIVLNQVKSLAKELGYNKISLSELFNLYVYHTQGINFSFETTDDWIELIKKETSKQISPKVLKRIKELESGDIGLFDFEDGKDLATYLLYGDE